MNITRTSTSRRSFFATAAGIAGGGLALSGFRPAFAQSSGSQMVTDVDVLQYALSLENLENAFYKGLSQFTAADFQKSSVLQPFGSKIASNVYQYLGEIGSHEQAHVATLNSVIKSLGATPVAPCTYNFGVSSPDDFLRVAMALENTGVTAYDGAIGLLTNQDLIQAGATIATVEARHASYLNALNSAIPFPSAFDEGRTMAQVLAIAGQFITACAGNPTGGSVNPNAPRVVLTPATLRSLDVEVQLDASNSQSTAGMAVTFMLAQVSGPQAAILGATTSTPRVRLLGGAGQYVFEETVTDLNGNSAKARSVITY